ncbi:hypothetical protein KKI23_03235, partial [Patescibacteria group bacterium]|nr:hypothetical protein [Patescibacteria group bacterium]
DETLTGQAYQAALLTLNPLTAGNHELTISAKSGDNEDAILKKITVVDSYWQKDEQSYYQLSENMEITGSGDSQTTLVFLDKNRGYFYRDLVNLSYTWGERVDQQYARTMAAELLNQYFEESNNVPGFDGSVYQTPEGGIAILPYSSAELPLSAHLAELAGEEFDTIALTNYFYQYLDNADSSLEEISLALYGLANLDEPVLNATVNLLQNQDIQPTERIYLALALDELGASEYARTIYYDIIENQAEAVDPYIRVVLGEDEDDYLSYTILTAILANRLSASEQEQLFNYIQDKYPTDILLNSEKLIYLKEALPELSADPASFHYQAGDRSDTVTLAKGQHYTLSVNPDELSNIQFSDISGNVGLVSYYPVPVTAQSITPDNNIGVSRTYTKVGSGQTNLFSQNDIVKVTITATIKANAIDDRYQVTDYLPSGLSIMADPYTRLNYAEYDASWPYRVDGQRISFNVWKDWNRTIIYYARIRNLGQFKADPVMMQGFVVKDSLNLSASDTVTIQ